MVENVTQIKIEITITDNVSAKNEKTSSIWKKKNGILVHVLEKMVNVQEVL